MEELNNFFILLDNYIDCKILYDHMVGGRVNVEYENRTQEMFNEAKKNLGASLQKIISLNLEEKIKSLGYHYAENETK